MAHDPHALFRDNIPAYAIGALDPDEIAALEAHLQTCASCRTELAGYRLVSESLLLATPPKQPPRALRQRLQSRLPNTKKTTRPFQNWSFSQIVLGFVMLILLAVNITTFLQLQGIQHQQTKLLTQTEKNRIMLAMLSSPNSQTLPIRDQNISGNLLLDKKHNKAILLIQDLPPLPENQAYQIWLIQPDGKRISAGLFRPEASEPYTAEIISVSQPLTNFLGIGVTIEPASGSKTPTGERIFKVDF
jgi:anti-sigma-K factor RskA